MTQYSVEFQEEKTVRAEMRDFSRCDCDNRAAEVPSPTAPFNKLLGLDVPRCASNLCTLTQQHIAAFPAYKPCHSQLPVTCNSPVLTCRRGTAPTAEATLRLVVIEGRERC